MDRFKFISNALKIVEKYIHRIYEVWECISHIFGYSHLRRFRFPISSTLVNGENSIQNANPIEEVIANLIFKINFKTSHFLFKILFKIQTFEFLNV